MEIWGQYRMSDIYSNEASILKKVEARIKEEALPVPLPSKELTFEEVIKCEYENSLGDAKIFAHLHRGKVVYVHLWERWLRWTGQCWEADLNAHFALMLVDDVAQEYLRAAVEVKKEIDSPQTSAEGIKYYQARLESLRKRAFRIRGNTRKQLLEYVHSGADPLSIKGTELDANPALFALPNGVMDLDVCDVRQGRPEDWLTIACPTAWEGYEAKSPIFDAFILDMLSEDQELVRFVLRFMGMSLFGRQREHVFLVFYGERGRNGKDTLMGILQFVLGTQMCSDIPAELLMERRNSRDPEKAAPDLMNLRGKRIAYASESGRKHRFCSETVKRLTGGGSITARGLHDNHMTSWEMTHSLVLLTNDLPAAPAEDEAFWNRFLGVELRRRYVDNPDPNKPEERPKDIRLREKMEAEAPGILARLIEGYIDYTENGLNPPSEVTAFRDEYRRGEDVVGRFLEDFCILHESEKTQASQLYHAFDFWYRENINSRGGYQPKRFAADLKKKGFVTKKVSVNFYQGIGLTSDAQSQIESNRGEYDS